MPKGLTHEEQTRLIAQGMLAELPPEQRGQCEQCMEELKAAMLKHDGIGLLAFAILGAQLEAVATDEAATNFHTAAHHA